MKNLVVIAHSGMKVNVYEDEWVILANGGKGCKVKVGWLHAAEMPNHDKDLILEVYIFYLRTKVASTLSGVVGNSGPFLRKGIPDLTKVKIIWSGLKTNQKKGLNQFFGTLCKLGNDRYKDFHDFTSSNLDKNKRNSLDSSKGALTEIEFDSLAKHINYSLRNFDWKIDQPLSFYQSSSFFSELRNHISNKLLISLVRRPIQLSILKWSDIIPTGSTFNDPNVSTLNEIGTVGAKSLQLRIFIAKSKGSTSPRAFPEKYPLHLSEDLSKYVLQYKLLYLKGLKLLMNSCAISTTESRLIQLMNNMPIFPVVEVFSLKFDSIEMFENIFTTNSSAYHASDNIVSSALRWVSVESDRTNSCMATSNRVRHTVLTRGAQDGLPVALLAKITGVTVPAARHYIDLDYKSRRMFDVNYIGNEFLRSAFSDQVSELQEGEDCIVDSHFNPVGGPRDARSCSTCSTSMGRPIGCYGCPNFRPILEANHRTVLKVAQDKANVNRHSLFNPLLVRSIEKLERQISLIQYTIYVCDDILSKQKAIDIE